MQKLKIVKKYVFLSLVVELKVEIHSIIIIVVMLR